MTIFKTNIWEYPSNKLARTRTLDMKNYIYYANIIFNTKDFVFNTDHKQDEANKVDFHSVLLHEMGHVFGLKHSDDNDSVMQSELGFNKKRELTNYDIFQIRNWEDTSGYILIGLDLREYYSSPVRDINNAKFYIFLLTKSEMSYELQNIGQNSHGNAEINKENKHVSKSIKLKCDSSNDTFRYFFKKYLVSEELFFDNSVINRNNIPCVKKFDKVTIKEIYNSQKDIEEELDNLIERQVFLNNLLEEQKYNNLLKYLLERVLLPEIDLNLEYLSEFEKKLVT